MAFNVVLDYGHGGSKSGATHQGAIEKQLNMLTGNHIYQSLRSKGNENDIRVLLTRDEDYDVPLRTRCDMINLCENKYNVDLAVSVHHNAASVSSANGFEVFYLKGSENGSSAAQLIVESVKKSGVKIRGPGKKTTEELGRKLAFIHKTVPPAVLIEIGFLTNDVDRNNAMLPAFRKQIGESVANGIWQYLERQGG